MKFVYQRGSTQVLFDGFWYHLWTITRGDNAVFVQIPARDEAEARRQADQWEAER